MIYTIAEFGSLTSFGESDGLESQVISEASFDALKHLTLSTQDKGLDSFRLMSRDGHESIQALNYVGIISLSTGDQIEILPKVTRHSQSLKEARRILLKMLGVVSEIKYLQSGMSSLDTLSRPWLDALVTHYLAQVSSLVRSGLKKQYVRTNNERNVIKGQLQVAKQMRQRPGRQQFFHVSYDEYHLNRPENRLLKTTLEIIDKWPISTDNQRLLRELTFSMDAIPSSSDSRADLNRWSHQRDMVRYQPLLPWIKLILDKLTPIFGLGAHQGISLLFPMETLFEDYVTICLTRKTDLGYVLRPQARSEYLVKHRDRNWFNLRPDLLVMDKGEPFAVLDTKWKLLDSRDDTSDKKYGLSQADFYQMFAYGERYLNGKGNLALIYPAHDYFQEPLPPFHFGTTTLYVLPFDLVSDSLRLLNPAMFGLTN